MRVIITGKRSLERRVEAATWGFLLIWVGVVNAIEGLPNGVPAVGAGAILLLSWLVQRMIGGEAGIVFWGAGLGLALWGLGDLTEGTRPSVFSMVLIGVGVFVVVRALADSSKAKHLRAVRRDDVGSARRPVEP